MVRIWSLTLIIALRTNALVPRSWRWTKWRRKSHSNSQSRFASFRRQQFFPNPRPSERGGHTSVPARYVHLKRPSTPETAAAP
jgi:hypothetical protein